MCVGFMFLSIVQLIYIFVYVLSAMNIGVQKKSTANWLWIFFKVNLFLCALKRNFNFIKLAAELFVGFGKVCDGLAGVKHCCVVAFANVKSYLGC